MKRLLCLLLLMPLSVLAADWSARPLSEIAIYAEYRAPANVVPANEARIMAEVAGRIEALPLRVGQSIEKGGELARLDASAYRIEVDRATAQVELVGNRIRLAEAQLAQSRQLAERRFISADGLRIKETELAVLRSEHEAARQGLAAARLALTRTVIRSPYTGTVKERLASVGDLAAPGTALLVLAASVDTELRARVPAAQVDSLQAAGAWSLVAAGSAYPVRLLRVSPVVEVSGQAREAVFGAAVALPPGLAGELRWRGVTAQLPASFVQQREGGLGAYVERDGKAVFVPLPAALASRPAPVDWPLATRVIDDGRFAIGLQPAVNEGAGR